jgi:hypothetical protein
MWKSIPVMGVIFSSFEDGSALTFYHGWIFGSRIFVRGRFGSRDRFIIYRLLWGMFLVIPIVRQNLHER